MSATATSPGCSLSPGLIAALGADGVAAVRSAYDVADAAPVGPQTMPAMRAAQAVAQAWLPNLRVGVRQRGRNSWRLALLPAADATP